MVMRGFGDGNGDGSSLNLVDDDGGGHVGS